MKKLFKLVLFSAITTCIASTFSCNNGNEDEGQANDFYLVVASDDGNGTATADPTVAEAGTTITLTASPGNRYIFEKWTVVEGTFELNDPTANPASFTMPDENVEIMAEFVEFDRLDYIADPAFREYCTKFDTDEDNFLTLEEALAVTSIDVSNWGMTPIIKSMSGVEIFVNLKELNCAGNSLTALNISSNTALMKLECYNSGLASLDISNNAALEILDCGTNQITGLDLSRNTALKQLNCGGNRGLISLDVSHNVALRVLLVRAASNLTTLNINGAVALEELNLTGTSLAALDVSTNAELRLLESEGTDFDAEALRTIFSALPMRTSSDEGYAAFIDNPGSNGVTAEDIKITEDKNWSIDL